jgi:hypothetical protein
VNVPSTPPSSGGTDLINIEVKQTATGQVSIKLNGTAVAEGVKLDMADVGGSIAVHATAGASVQVTEMLVAPAAEVAQRWIWLTPSDGITGGGDAATGSWRAKADPTFRNGQGFTSPGGNTTLAKWNFVGVKVRLWMPKGPEYGSVSVSVDGTKPMLVDLHAAEPVASAAVYAWEETTDAVGRARLEHRHALVVRWVSGGIAADSAEFLPPPVSPTSLGHSQPPPAGEDTR